MDGSGNRCRGSPSSNLVNSGPTFSEWPDNIPGLICKTAPFGYYHAPRLAECCSGKVYNITEPTSPGDEAYPMSCALFCQVDPKLDESDDRYPYGFSEHFMCLSNGTEEYVGGEVICATVSAENGAVAPTSYPHTWTGDWQTRTYTPLDIADSSWTWIDEDAPSGPPATSTHEEWPTATPVSELTAPWRVSSESIESPTTNTQESIETSHATTSLPSTREDDSASSTAAETPSPTGGAGSTSSLTTRGLLAGLLLITAFVHSI